MLEEWQRMFDVVLNTTVSLLNIDGNGIDLASQEAMGDHSKIDIRDSDNDLRHCASDCLLDRSWADQENETYSYSYDGFERIEGIFDTQCSDLKSNHSECSEHENKRSNALFVLPEETSSQLATEISLSEIDEVAYDNLIDL